MCFYQSINGEIVLCCFRKACINVVIKACQQTIDVPQEARVQQDNTWIMLHLPILLVMLLVLGKKRLQSSSGSTEELSVNVKNEFDSILFLVE